MVAGDRKSGNRRWWTRSALVAGGLATGFAGFGSWQSAAADPPAVQTAPMTEAAAPAVASSDSDYVSKPVAFIGRDTIVTREELGEFLILRRGFEKVDTLVNQRIIDRACKEADVEVSGGEIELSLAEDLKGLGGITQGDFVKQVLRRYNKNLVEWKQDVIRPKLMLGKLCRTRVQVTEDDIREAFEAKYGEKVEGRIIQWSNKTTAEAAYAKLRASDLEFDEQARHQEVGPLASTGGKIKPINRHLAVYNPAFKEKESNDRIEGEAFRLQQGDMSGLIEVRKAEMKGLTLVPGCYVVLKCDRRVPADTTINPAAVREELVKDITERKTLAEIPKVVQELRDKAQPKPFEAVKAGNTLTPFTPGCSRGRIVATIYGNEPITREDLGEYLIARYGARTLDLVVNKHIIDDECKAKGITVEAGEIDTTLAEKIAAAGGPDNFKEALRSNHTSESQYREDVLRPQLQLAKLSAGRVKVSDADVQAAFEAYFGEKVECRLILWPREERKYAMNAYAELRDSEKAFAAKARSQASQELAKNDGHLMDGKNIRLIGKHTLGDPELEREIFNLQPGEVSKLVETPEGIVIAKCDRRYPADTSVSLEAIRPKLLKDVTERKVQLEIPVVFAELRKKADPRLLLRDPDRPVDLAAEVNRDLNGGSVPKSGGKNRGGKNPSGN
jgi:hypothetical protein